MYTKNEKQKQKQIVNIVGNLIGFSNFLHIKKSNPNSTRKL